MMINPLISIITPTYNCENDIEAALKSVANQSYSNIEHLIIDGNSSDRTLDIIKKYQLQYNHIKVISEKDSGIYDAMNKGIKLAKGDWLYFMGSDDRFINENVLLELKSYLTSDLDIFYGDVIFKLSGKKYDGKFSKIKLLRKNICHQSMFTRKSVFNVIGYFDTDYRVLADWHFNMKWFNNRKIKSVYLKKTIAYYNELGFSFNNTDEVYIQQWKKNIETFFPFYIRLAYRIGYNRVFQKIKQVFMKGK